MQLKRRGWDNATAIGLSKALIDDRNCIVPASELMYLSSSTEYVKKYQNKLELTFTGYESDRRRIVDIPEVHSYFRALTALWPFWLHFLDRDGHSLNLAYQLFSGVVGLEYRDGRPGFLLDPEASDATIAHACETLLTAGVALRAHHGMSHEGLPSIADLISTIK